MIAFVLMRYNEKNGHWPLMKPKTKAATEEVTSDSNSSSAEGVGEKEFGKSVNEVMPSSNIRQVDV